jgi:hypothetical protein
MYLIVSKTNRTDIKPLDENAKSVRLNTHTSQAHPTGNWTQKLFNAHAELQTKTTSRVRIEGPHATVSSGYRYVTKIILKAQWVTFRSKH